MDVISSRISGWRVTDSMTLPKMMPMPTPAPAAPRPPPTPRAMDLPAFETSPSRAAMIDETVVMVAPWFLVGFGDGAAEVDGSQGGEDERLQRGDQPDLEEEEDDPERQGQPAQGGDAQQHGQRAAHEEDDQVAREDVGEQSHGERHQPHDVREQLEHEQEAGHPARPAAGDQALEVAADALGPDALGGRGD